MGVARHSRHVKSGQMRDQRPESIGVMYVAMAITEYDASEIPGYINPA
jgi:hypothetical protein